mgnify:CR=1 FL=1
MATYSNTATATLGTSEVSTTMQVPGGTRLKKLFAMSVTGTGVVYQLRLEFPGVKLPQTYLLPVLNALEGTEVGSGQKKANYLDVDIPVPTTVNQITIFGLASAASQSAVIGVIWTGPD